MSVSAPSVKKIGYVVNAFPVVSETFLINELRAVEEAGIEVEVFALSRRRDAIRHGCLQDLELRCHHPRRGLGSIAVAVTRHATMMGRQRGAYLRLCRRDLLGPSARLVTHPGRAAWRSLGRKARLFAAAVRIAASAQRCGVVHLHAHYAKEPLEVAARVRSLTGTPYSFAAHAKDLYTSPRRRLRRRLRRARFAVACHQHGFERLQAIAAGADGAKVLRIHHGLDTAIFNRNGAGARSRDILAVGRLTPKKGFDVLVRACARLRARGEDFRCTIIGEGRLRDELSALIGELDLGDRVTLRGFVPQESIVDWYRRATVVALPARVLSAGNRDGIPNVLVESLATGTPVVSTPVGGIRELVRDGRNGLLVPPDDPDALAEALHTVLTDADYRRRLAANASSSPLLQDFRVANHPLVGRFRELVDTDVAKVAARVGEEAWAPGGEADRAADRLGVRPKHRTSVESALVRSITPGLQANAWRPDFERMVRKRLWDEIYKARRLETMELFGRFVADVERPARVLDLGCGRGGLTVALRARGADAAAVDIRPRNCRTTRRRGRRYGLDVPVCVAAGERLPFRDDAFDTIFMLELLEHVQDPKSLLHEAHRICRPTGRCVITVVNRWAHLDPHYHLWGINFMPRAMAREYIVFRRRAKESWRDNQTLADMHYYSFRRFERFAATAGFEVVDLERPEAIWARLAHRAGRWASLGFNTATLTLVPRG